MPKHFPKKVGAIPQQPVGSSVTESTELNKKTISANNRELFLYMKEQNKGAHLKSKTEEQLATLLQEAFLKMCNHTDELSETDAHELKELFTKFSRRIKSAFRNFPCRKALMKHLDGFFSKRTIFQFNEGKKIDIKEDNFETVPECLCKNGRENGPFYTHLGHAKTLYDVKANIVNRFNAGSKDKNDIIEVDNIRIVKAFHRKDMQLNSMNCPEVQTLITPGNEKILVVVKQRPGHYCQYTYIVLQIIIYNVIDKEFGQEFFSFTSDCLGKYGVHKERGKTEKSGHKDCPAQGDPTSGGGSFTFFCTKTPLQNKCKWFNSWATSIRNVKLMQTRQNRNIEDTLEQMIVKLAQNTIDSVEKAVPKAFHNMNIFSDVGNMCRIPTGPKRPYAGCTAVLDYCAHTHRDSNNMASGCTVLVSLVRPNAQPQYHVLPNYYAEAADNVEVRDCRGGLGMALPNRSILLEAAKRENHASTHLQNPSRSNPNRLGVVFFQHRGLTEPYHQSQKVEQEQGN